VPTDNAAARGLMDELFGNALSLLPGEATSAAKEQLLDLYAYKMKREKSNTTGQLDREAMKEAFRERFGGDLPEWNGVKVIPPQYGWDKARWRDWLYSLPPDLGLGRKLIDGKDRGSALPILPSVKREVTAELLVRNGRFHTIGDGKYLVELQGPNGWEFLVDPSNGGRFILDRGKIRERGATPSFDTGPTFFQRVGDHIRRSMGGEPR